MKNWLKSFWNWLKPGWKCRPYVDPEDQGAGVVCSKEWNDPSEESK